MNERKRFQSQTLNRKDYEKTEEGARAVKEGGRLLGAVVILVGVAKKYGPSLLNSIKKIRKS